MFYESKKGRIYSFLVIYFLSLEVWSNGWTLTEANATNQAVDKTTLVMILFKSSWIIKTNFMTPSVKMHVWGQISNKEKQNCLTET